jgi:dinuclear metal center YbgI/SA1388 family protein
LLLTHHPLIYRPIQDIRGDQAQGRILQALIQADMAHVACHTNLDLAPGGLNDFLAQLLELQGIQVIAEAQTDPWYKLATFVPLGYEDRLRQALFDDRVGVIGAYRHCSFACRGQGTYLPQEGAKPFRGEVASLSRAEEVRLEMVVPGSRWRQAVGRLKAAHPYEEVAYDLYPLHQSGFSLGFGRLGRWPQPVSFPDVVTRLKTLFRVDLIKVWGRPPAAVQQVAVIGGSGGDYLEAARRQGAQLLITGEVRHHQANLTQPDNFAAIEVGHFHSEVVFMPEWARQLNILCQNHGLDVRVLAAQTETAPFSGW